MSIKKLFTTSLCLGLFALISASARADNVFVRMYNHTQDEIKVIYSPSDVAVQSGQIDTLKPGQQGAVVWFRDWSNFDQKAIVILLNKKTYGLCTYKIRQGPYGSRGSRFDMSVLSNDANCAPAESDVHPSSGFNIDIRNI